MPKSKPKLDRLFVPLSTEPYRWFTRGDKQWELRKRARQFTEKHVRSGRIVELRKGYSSKESTWGVIKDVITANSVSETFDRVPFEHIVPTAESREEAAEDVSHILSLDEGARSIGLIAFQVDRGIQVLDLADKFLPLVFDGRKRTTVRKGQRTIKKGPALLRSEEQTLPIKIVGKHYKKYSELTREDAVRDGFNSLQELRDALHEFYPDLADSDTVTVVEFGLQSENR